MMKKREQFSQNYPAVKVCGFVLPSVLILLGIMAVYMGAIFSLLSTDTQILSDTRDFTEALYVAEAGANWLTDLLWVGFSQSQNPIQRLAWLDTNWEEFSDDTVSRQAPGYELSGESMTYNFSAWVADYVIGPGPLDRTVVIQSIGRVGEDPETATQRAVTRVYVYGFGQSSVFDFAYFINNFGWFWGSAIRAHGEVGSNGDFSMRHNPTVNGDIYAAENPERNAAGDIEGTNIFHNPTQYQNVLNTFAGRARHANGDQSKYFDGHYHYRSQQFSNQRQLDMPYLEDISVYEAIAHDQEGTVSIAGNTVINRVHNGKIALIGTADNPIVINGPVVVKGDLAIRGVVRGQGTIYTERNVHIVGDLTYETLPDLDSGVSGDLLGLAARGSVLLGDYTKSSWNSVKTYIKPNFTQPFIDENGNWFHGDYTQFDGGKKSDNTNRRYFESSWSDEDFTEMCSTDLIRRVDAVAYTNRLFGGRGNRYEQFGSIISRDEAIVVNTSGTMLADSRTSRRSQDWHDINLPKVARIEQIAWEEGAWQGGNPNKYFNDHHVRVLRERAVQPLVSN